MKPIVPESENAALSKWNAPECHFTIEYSPRALDDIRLTVVEAFFSLQHGGVEAGGILFGNWDGKRLAITGYAALDCEHAFGPSFTLSPRDEGRLAELLAAPVGKGLRPAGWYHSHTRSEIFLSDADQQIHRRFFPEPWQVALVLKPHTFHPTRAGFFFRGVDGGIHAETSYNEFVLSPLALKPGAPGVPATDHPKPAPAPVSGPIPFRNGAPPEPPPPPAAEPAAPAETLPLPKFLDLPQPRSRRFLKVTLALLAGFALGAAAYLTRDNWLPPLLALARPAPPSSLGLNTIDYNGQLQIRWNSNSAAVQQATGGALSIDSGGAVPQEISLDKAHLLSGVVTIARQAPRVDVSLSLTDPDGRPAREATTFMGKLPDADDAAAQQQRDNLAKQVAKMQSDLNTVKKTVDQHGRQLRERQ